MLLIEYIEKYYGSERGNKASFLRDHPEILPTELSRWLRNEFKVNIITREIYKPSSKKVKY